MSDERPGYEPEPVEAAGQGQERPRLGAVARIVRLYVAPGEVFADIARRPGWLAPMLLLVALTFASTLYITGKIDMTATMERWQETSGVELDEAQLERATEHQPNPLVRATMSVAVVPVAFLLLGGIYLVTGKAVGSEAEFAETFSVTLHAYLAPSLVKTVLTCLLLIPRSAMAAQDLETVLASNLAAFLPQDAPGWLRAVGGTLDLFNVWIVVLLAMGLATVGRLSRGRAVTAALIPWGVWIALKGAGAAVLGALVRR